jgi:hypothetical protein
VSVSPYVRVPDVAARFGQSERWVHERTRTNQIPHLVLPGSRPCLFRIDWLEAWEMGAALEIVEPAHGGRIVRPVSDERKLRSVA